MLQSPFSVGQLISTLFLPLKCDGSTLFIVIVPLGTFKQSTNKKAFSRNVGKYRRTAVLKNNTRNYITLPIGLTSYPQETSYLLVSGHPFVYYIIRSIMIFYNKSCPFAPVILILALRGCIFWISLGIGLTETKTRQK